MKNIISSGSYPGCGAVAAAIIITALYWPLYLWFASYVLNNTGCFRNRKIETLLFGAVGGGLLIGISLLVLCYYLITG